MPDWVAFNYKFALNFRFLREPPAPTPLRDIADLVDRTKSKNFKVLREQFKVNLISFQPMFLEVVA